MPIIDFSSFANSLAATRYGDCLALIAGVLLALAFAPFDWAYLAFVALALLFVIWEAVSPVRAALRGFLFGLGLFGFGVSWVFVSVRYYGGADLFSSISITLLFVSVWALFPALTGYLAVKIRSYRRRGMCDVLILPCLWQLVDYFRGVWFLNGFPWLQVAYSQLATPIAGYIPVLGSYGAGFIVVLIVNLALRCGRGKRHTGFALSAICLLTLCGQMLKQVAWTHPIGPEITVSLLQGNISQEQKWAPENRDRTLRQYLAMTDRHWRSDIVVWPETSIPAYYSEVKDAVLQPLEQNAIEHNSSVVVSLPMTGQTADIKYNTLLVLGKTPSIYHKNHLLPFGEYLPLQPLSGKILDFLNMRLGQFTPGGDWQSLPVAAGYPFAASICYEDAISRELLGKLPQAAFLINVTNDAWFGRSIEPFQHLQIARMRALESGRYLLRATNTGVTAIVSPRGAIIADAPIYRTATVNGAILPMGGNTPYAETGDEPLVLFFMLTVLFCIAGRYTKTKLNEE